MRVQWLPLSVSIAGMLSAVSPGVRPRASVADYPGAAVIPASGDFMLLTDPVTGRRIEGTVVGVEAGVGVELWATSGKTNGAWELTLQNPGKR